MILLEILSFLATIATIGAICVAGILSIAIAIYILIIQIRG